MSVICKTNKPISIRFTPVGKPRECCYCESIINKGDTAIVIDWWESFDKEDAQNRFLCYCLNCGNNERIDILINNLIKESIANN